MKVLLDTGDCDTGFDISLVWQIGEAVVKVKMPEPGVTREHVTMEEVRKRNFTFRISEVYYHMEFQGLYYIVTSKAPGVPLWQAWRSFDWDTKHFVTNRVAEICIELATWKGKTISGVDGNYLGDVLLSPLVPGSYPCEYNLDCEATLQSARRKGLDCSSLVFYHCDLSSANIIIDVKTKSFTVIDWEMAGFVPRDYVATRFCLAPALATTGGQKDRLWPNAITSKLAESGFKEVSEEFLYLWREEEGIPQPSTLSNSCIVQ